MKICLFLAFLMLVLISCVYISKDDTTIVGTWKNNNNGIVYFDSDGFFECSGLEINLSNVRYTEKGNGIFIDAVKLHGPHFLKVGNKLQALILEGGEFSKFSEYIEIDGFKLKKLPRFAK